MTKQFLTSRRAFRRDMANNKMDSQSMNDPMSKGFPFDLKDLWRESTYVREDGDWTLFQPLSADLWQLELLDEGFAGRHSLYIPELDEHDGYEQQIDTIENEETTLRTILEGHDPILAPLDDDVWNLNLEFEGHRAMHQLHTWESFEKKEIPNPQKTAYLSEAGTKVFDAALAHLEKEPRRDGVLPQDTFLRALFNLALGRSSVFFQWDAAKDVFIQTLPDVPISGLSFATSKSFIEGMIELGSLYRTLEDYTTSRVPSRASCTATVAFKGCITAILDGVEQHIASGFPHIASLLELHRLVERAHQLLRLVWELTRSIEQSTTDEEVISNLSNCTRRLVSAENHFAVLLRSILANTSRPWLERLCTELGIIHVRLVHPSSESVEDYANIDDDFSSAIPLGLPADESLPTLITSGDRQLISQTKASIKILREHMPDYEVCQAALDGAQLIADTAHGQEERDITSTLGEVTPARKATEALLKQDVPNTDSSNTFTDSTEDCIWRDDAALDEYLHSVDARISQPIDALPKSSNDLQVCVLDNLRNDRHQIIAGDLSADLEFNPLEHLRPLIHQQLVHVNTTLLRHILWNLQLRHHLELQKRYHLLGNGEFVTRLSTALFSADTQSAERRRGAIPTGETMGLRLGARGGQRWPPASSELRLTLMDVLKESYNSDQTNKTFRANEELPGGLSFSIRELPEEEIERVLDSGSIYAMDFLRLQYTAPPCLEEILTPSAMKLYDGIFRFLLRLLRAFHVTTKLKAGLATDRSPNHQRAGLRANVGFALEAHDFISIFMAHIMDVGIEAPWQLFTASIAQAEQRLVDNRASDDASFMGLEELRQLHEEVLERIRNRLFLRRKQEKIQRAIEAVLETILNGAAAFENHDPTTPDTGLTSIRESISEFIRLLRDTVNRNAKTAAKSNAAESDAEATKLLLLRLKTDEMHEDTI